MANVTSFKKGQSGNPSGRPKENLELQRICRTHGPDIVDFYLKVVKDKEQETSDRITAARLILEYGYGKPKQQTEIVGENEGPVRLIVEVISK